MNQDFTKQLKDIIDSTTSDIYVYIGNIDSNLQALRDLVCKHSNKKSEADLFLITNGGDPDWAYRIVSTLRLHYEKLNLVIPSACKSAGTLIALGADTLRFHKYGELGPLDVQMQRKDDLFRLNSGLDVFQAISVINNSACGCFHNMFVEFLAKGGGSISTETASKIAKDLAIGIYSSIASKIDPLELGEKNRAMNIASAYGNILSLLSKSPNLKQGTLEKLVKDYPSHSFVIDIQQATQLFNRVDEMTENDYKVYNLFCPYITKLTPNTLVIRDLAVDYQKLQQDERTEKDDRNTYVSQSSASKTSGLSSKSRAKSRTKTT